MLMGYELIWDAVVKRNSNLLNFIEYVTLAWRENEPCSQRQLNGEQGLVLFGFDLLLGLGNLHYLKLLLWGLYFFA